MKMKNDIANGKTHLTTFGSSTLPIRTFPAFNQRLHHVLSAGRHFLHFPSREPHDDNDQRRHNPGADHRIRHRQRPDVETVSARFAAPAVRPPCRRLFPAQPQPRWPAPLQRAGRPSLRTKPQTERQMQKSIFPKRFTTNNFCSRHQFHSSGKHSACQSRKNCLIVKNFTSIFYNNFLRFRAWLISRIRLPAYASAKIHGVTCPAPRNFRRLKASCRLASRTPRSSSISSQWKKSGGVKPSAR